MDHGWLNAAWVEPGEHTLSTNAPARHWARAFQAALEMSSCPTGPLGPCATGRFAWYTATVVSLPEPDIRDYLSLELLSGLLHQLRFDHWRRGIGYISGIKTEERNLTLTDDVLRKWGMTPEHLRLEAGVEEIQAPGWAPAQIEEEWQALAQHAHELVGVVPPANRKASIVQLFSDARAETFRGAGISAAYAFAEHELQRRAVAIKQRIEKDLWEDWREGRRSLHGCGVILSLLREYLVEHERNLEHGKRNLDTQTHLAEQAVHGLLDRTTPTGWRRWTGSPNTDAALLPLLQACRHAAVQATWAAQTQAAQRFVLELQSLLTVMQGMVDSAELSLGAMAHETDREAAAHLPPECEIDAPLFDRGLASRRERLALRDARVSGEAVFWTHLAEVRPGAFSRWGNRPNFRALAQWLDDDAARPALQALCAHRVNPQVARDFIRDQWASLGQHWQRNPTLAAQDLDDIRRRSPPPVVTETGVEVRVGWAWPAALDATLTEPLPEAFRGPLKAGNTSGLVAWQCLRPTPETPWPQIQFLTAGASAWRCSQGSAARGLRMAPPFVRPACLPGVPQTTLARAALLLAHACDRLAPAQEPGDNWLHILRDTDGFEAHRQELGPVWHRDAPLPRDYVLGPLFDDVLDHLPPRPTDGAALEQIRARMHQRIQAVGDTTPESGREWHEAARVAMKILRQEQFA